MKKIEIGHGGGGRLTRDLIQEVFLKHLKGDHLHALEDAATLSLKCDQIAMTTDSYVVHPLFFPGGNIGTLAICGTVNDLAVSGAIPQYISLGLILEEGLPLDTLEQIIMSISEAARDAGVQIVTGDTKVVEKGKGDGIYINTTGIGSIVRRMSAENIESGDVIICTGTLGDHGTAIALAREEFPVESELTSDCAALNKMLEPLFKIDGIRWMRDPTRGSTATVMVELADASGLGIQLFEDSIPLRNDVRFITEMLGFDPLYLANEGKAIIAVSESCSVEVLRMLHNNPLGVNACVIGKVTSDFKGVRLRTVIGGERSLIMAEEETLPRIC
ncbi:hydrogenase expression/formation protein HypE [bacterium]|nr:hydrogenase expression/formation protein HypE [bacterium]